MKPLVLFLVEQALWLERLPLAVFAGGALLLRRVSAAALQRGAAAAAVPAAAGILAGYAAILAGYVLRPDFYDPAEPSVASLAWAFRLGQPLYHAIDAPERYSLAYGPALAGLHGALLGLAGPSTAAAKLGGALAIAGAVALLAWAVAREAGGRAGLLHAGAFVLAGLMFRNASWWNRPDPFLCLLAAGGFLAVRALPPAGAAAALAASLALAVSLKIHGFLGLLPFLAVLHERGGLKPLAGALGGAAALALLPFGLVDGLSARHYLAWVAQAGRHGFTLEQAWVNLQYLLLLALPLGAGLRAGRDAPPGLRRMAATTAVAVLVALAFASKQGSGAYQLLSLLPAVSLLGVRVRKEAPLPPATPGRAALAGALVATLALTALAVQLRLHWALHIRERGLVEDFRDALGRAGGQPVAVGCTDDRSIERTAARAEAAFAGHPLVVELSALADMEHAGRPLPAATLAALEAGRPPVWILPADGLPFSAASPYGTGRPVYPEAFRETFLRRYRPGERTRYFRLWVHDGARGGSPAGTR
jgi:hypothetical protein